MLYLNFLHILVLFGRIVCISAGNNYYDSASQKSVTYVCYSCVDVFLERPGDGDEVIYSPVGVSVTLNCVVRGSILYWGINGDYYDESEPEVTSRGIFLQAPTTISADIEMSSLTVIGNISNNNLSICCQVLVQRELMDACTTLMIYYYGMIIIIVVKI